MSAPPGDASSEDRLDSWKEIAGYLGREARTVQGWEKTEGLPVHRHQHARQGSVYAFRSELDAWRKSRHGAPEPAAVPVPRRRVLAIGAAGLLVAGAVWAGIAIWEKRGPAPSIGISSVAVLPFLDLSPEKNQDYFSDGLTEEIIDALSRVPNLRVVARTSAFAFKGRNIDIRQIGQQLNVTAVLEGSVRKSGDALRITAQLNRVTDGYHLWSRTFDRKLSDVFAVQREISESIAGQLRAGPVPPRAQTQNMEAYRLYQEGRYFFNQFQPPESNLKAIERYELAVKADPGFALAWSGMADAYAYQAENFVQAPREVMPKAREAAAKALALDDSSAEAHTSMGTVRLDYDRDLEGGQREFLRALQLNPGSGYAHHWYAHSLEARNRVPDALKEMRTALDLDPLSIPIHWDIAVELITLGRYDEAIALMKHALELFPGVPLFSYMEAESYYRKGDVAAAHTVVEEIRKNAEAMRDPAMIALSGVAAARDGNPAEGHRILAQLEAMRASHYVEPMVILELCAALNDRAALRTWLRRADEEKSALFVYLPTVSKLEGLDPAMLAEALRK